MDVSELTLSLFSPLFSSRLSAVLILREQSTGASGVVADEAHSGVTYLEKIQWITEGSSRTSSYCWLLLNMGTTLTEPWVV